MELFDSIAGTLRARAATAGPAVVTLGGHPRGGSGFVVAPGRVLTNAHNTRGDDLAVRFADGREARAKRLGTDIDGDLAVLEVDTGEIAPLEWAGAPPELGQAVFAVTNAPGAGTRVTIGTVSSVNRAFRGPRGRRIGGTIEHTAPLAPGSSGSPVLDASGKVLGINTNRLGDGFYLAIPAGEALLRRVQALARGETVETPRLGVSLLPSRVARRLRHAVGLPERDGLLISDIEDGSPAEAAGLREGDLIVEAGGEAVATFDGLSTALGRADKGGALVVRVLRGADEVEVSVTLG
jgi:serine protease Do